LEGRVEDFIIKKVLLRTDGIKYVIIPKDSKLNQGDYIVITKVKEGIKNG
jgi:hypothetical protein